MSQCRKRDSGIKMGVRGTRRDEDKKRGLGMRSHNNQYTAYSDRQTRATER